jgi:TonB family protein
MTHYFGFFKKVPLARALHGFDCQASLYQGGIVSRRIVVALVAAVAIVGILSSSCVWAQGSGDDIVRRAKVKVQPIYPELASKMRISGTVKIEVTVAPNGTVKEARVVGGHPVLASAALDAAKKWRFEPAAGDSTGVIDFKFEPR